MSEKVIRMKKRLKTLATVFEGHALSREIRRGNLTTSSKEVGTNPAIFLRLRLIAGEHLDHLPTGSTEQSLPN